MEQTDRAQRIHAQIVDGLFRHAFFGMLATVINTIILAIVLWGEVPGNRVLIWLSTALLLVGARTGLVTAYRRSSPVPVQARVWGRALVTGLFLAGLLWGSTAVFLFPIDSPGHQALVAIALCGMVAGAVGAFSFLFVAVAAFCLPALVPLLARFLLIPDDVHRALAAMTFLFLVLSLATARRMSRANRERVELKELFADRLEERTREVLRSNERLRGEIEERKRAETALRTSEEKYRDLFDNIPDLLYVHDLEGRFLEANRAWEHYGFDRQELKKMNLKELLSERFRDEFDAYMKRLSENGWDEGIALFMRKDGLGLVVEYRNELVRDAQGRPEAVRGASRDVTERVQVRKEKEKLETQLMRAQRLEAIGTLAGGIAHNFNNLLMGIEGNATLGQMEIDASHPLFARLENIEELVERGSLLTSQLLAYAREGKYKIGRISLNLLVKETASTIEQTRKDLRIRVDLAEDLGGIDADFGQIQQTVMNLCINAADAMPNGGELLLQTRNVRGREIQKIAPDAKLRDYVRLSVRDTGVGMDTMTMEKIFDPFFTTKKIGEGTGLGLASVEGVVESHGGVIHVESEVGRGTRFDIYLPASYFHVREDEMLKEEQTEKKHGTILLVDDEDVILEVGAEMIQSLGYQVLKARSGQEALDVYAAQGHEVDLVVLDLIMPDMGGGETFDRLKEIDPDIRVLLSSGYGINGEATEILERGCTSFIQKPFRLSDLADKFMEILGPSS